MCANSNSNLTRRSILRAAVEIISHSGLDALTAGRLIEQASISKGGLYHHFRTMEAVETEVLELLTQGLLMDIREYPSPESKDDFFELMESQLLRCFAVDNLYVRALFGFISASAHNKTRQCMIRRFIDEVSLIRLEQLKKVSPNVSHIELHGIVQMISSLQIGLVTRHFLAEDLVSLKNYWADYRKMLVELLEKCEAHSFAQTREKVREMS